MLSVLFPSFISATIRGE